MFFHDILPINGIIAGKAILKKTRHYQYLLEDIFNSAIYLYNRLPLILELSQHSQDQLIKYFASGLTSLTAAVLVNINHKMATYYFHSLRQIIMLEIDGKTPTLII